MHQMNAKLTLEFSTRTSIDDSQCVHKELLDKVVASSETGPDLGSTSNWSKGKSQTQSIVSEFEAEAGGGDERYFFCDCLLLE